MRLAVLDAEGSQFDSILQEESPKRTFGGIEDGTFLQAHCLPSRKGLLCSSVLGVFGCGEIVTLHCSRRLVLAKEPWPTHPGHSASLNFDIVSVPFFGWGLDWLVIFHSPGDTLQSQTIFNLSCFACLGGFPPSSWTPQPLLQPPVPPVLCNASSGMPVGAVWMKPSVAPHLPRQVPLDHFPSGTPTAPLSSCPLPCDLPIPSTLVHSASTPHPCPSLATSRSFVPSSSCSVPCHPRPLSQLSRPTLDLFTRSVPFSPYAFTTQGLPRLRVMLPMARSLAAGLVHNWSLPYAPYLVVIFNFDACLDRDFIDRSRYCGVTTVWQSIFGALVACTFRERVLATLPNYC